MVKLLEETDALNAYGDALVDLGEVLSLAGRFVERESVLTRAMRVFEDKRNIVSAEMVERLLHDASVHSTKMIGTRGMKR